MGSSRKIYDGIAFPDPRVSDLASLAPNTATALTSDYGEADPRPGIPTANQDGTRTALRVSGGQSVDLDLAANQSGTPAIETGTQIVYRTSGAASTLYRGWMGPGTCVGFAAVTWDANTQSNFAAAVNEVTGQVLIVYMDSAAPTVAKAARFDLTDWSITAATDIPAGAPSGMAAFHIPSTDRVVVLTNPPHYTDDNGTTWQQYSGTTSGTAPTVAAYDHAKAVTLQGEVLVISDDGLGNVQQLVSIDLGVSFSEVFNGIAGIWSTVATSRGRFVVGTLDATAGNPGNALAYVLGSAGDSLADADPVTIDGSGDVVELELVSEPDGTLWAYLKKYNPASGVTIPQTEIALSTDGGESWTNKGVAHRSSSTTAVQQDNHRALHVAGYVLLLHNFQSSSSPAFNDSIALMVMSGWSNANPVSTTLGYRIGQSVNWTQPAVAGRHWLPYALPAAGLDWNSFVAGGLELQGAGPFLRLFTAAGDTIYYEPTAFGPALPGKVGFLADLRVGEGGNPPNLDICFRCVAANGTDDYGIELAFSTTQFTVTDQHLGAGPVATYNVDMTQRRIIWCSFDSTGNGLILVRSPGGEWATAYSGPLTSNTVSPRAGTFCEWGHIAAPAGNTRSDWFGVGFTGPEAKQGAQQTGRWLTADPVPLPEYGTTGALCNLSAVGGPAIIGERWTAEVAHDYPISAVFPAQQPSPYRGWRSTDLTEQIITWDLQRDTWLGDSLALYIGRANFGTAELEYYDGATWQSAGSWSAKVNGASAYYTIAGDTITPGALPTNTGRYIWEHELTDGYVTLPATSGTVARRIASNSAGFWTNQATTIQPRIVLGGIDGTEFSSQYCQIYAPSGVLVVHFATRTTARYWRVRIPAQVTPDAYYTAGVISLMRLVAWGAESSWGQGQQTDSNLLESSDLWGTSRIVQQGPQKTTWDLGWSDQTNHLQLRSSDRDTDYMAATGGLPLAGHEDLGMQVRGILEAVKGGEVPVVAIAQIPEDGVTLTDPTLYLYGHLLASLRLTQSAGDMGSTEIIRVDSISIRGIV